MNQSNFEFNKNSVYLRNRDLTLHYKKLQEIQSRKQGFIGKSDNSSRSANKKNLKTNLENQLKIKNDNNYLIGKLNQISKRDVSKLNNNDIYSYQTSRHFMNVQTIRKMKEKYLQEENYNIFKRLQVGTSAMNRDKLENNYKYHLKLKKLSQKVDTRFNNIYKENTLSLVSSKSKLPILKTTRETRTGLQSILGQHPSLGQYHGYTNSEKFFDKGNLAIIDNYDSFELKK